MNPIRIESTGEDLRVLVLRARRGEPWPPAARVYAFAWGLLFEVTREGLSAPASEEGPALLPGVRGPYCGACRRSLGGFSYTEWNVVEAETSALPLRCPSCEAELSPPSRDPASLISLVLSAARSSAGASGREVRGDV